MKHLGIAHSTIFDIAMKTQACSLTKKGAAYWCQLTRKNSKSPKCVFSPLCSAALVLLTNLRLHHKIKDHDVGIS